MTVVKQLNYLFMKNVVKYLFMKGVVKQIVDDISVQS